MLQLLRGTNAKFTLYGLAFVAETALNVQNGKGAHGLSGYLFDHKEQIKLWILQFLEQHGSNAASPLNMSCANTIANTLTSWRQIMQVTEPLILAAGDDDLDLGSALQSE